jgi:hypothetical protein
MYQRSSLYWQLSQLSPVTTANDNAPPARRSLAERVDRPHHGVAHLYRQHLLRPIAAADPAEPAKQRPRIAVAVQILHPGRRLRVEDVDVGEMNEREHRTALRHRRGRHQIQATQVRLAGAGHDRPVATRTGRAQRQRPSERGAGRRHRPHVAEQRR